MLLSGEPREVMRQQNVASFEELFLRNAKEEADHAVR
jgi:hypothetical protein